MSIENWHLKIVPCSLADHDNGSGGWTDRENVIEGNWEHYCGENSPVGCDCSPPSCAQDCPLSCPDAAGKQQVTLHYE